MLVDCIYINYGSLFGFSLFRNTITWFFLFLFFIISKLDGKLANLFLVCVFLEVV